MDYDLPNQGHGGKTMLRLDRSMSPLDPGAWKLSNIVRQPEIPATMTRNIFPDGNRPQLSGGWRDPLVWLEPNTVDVNGRIRAFCRCVFDEYAAAHIAAVFDYDPEAHRPELYAICGLARRTVQVLHHPRSVRIHVLDAEQPHHKLPGHSGLG